MTAWETALGLIKPETRDRQAGLPYTVPCSECAVDEGRDALLRSRANHLVDHLAALENEEGRNAHHPVLGRDLRIDVYIELVDAGLPFIFGRELLDRWSDRFARSAPTCPEVDENRHVRLENLFIEFSPGVSLSLSPCSFDRK